MDKIKKIIKASIDTKQSVLQNEGLLKTIAASVDLIVNAFRNGNRVYFCGNGGSAADAQHLAANFREDFIPIGKHCLQKHCIAILLT
jgi:D-sedoheptulose 7-phosphate isomerase